MTSAIALGIGLLLAVGRDPPVTEVAINPAADETEIVIHAEGRPDYRDFTMEGPNRLIVDLMGAQHALPADNFMDINRGGVRAVRTSQYSSEIVRVVIELERMVCRIQEENGLLRVRLENSMGAFQAWSSRSLGGNAAAQRLASALPTPAAQARQQAAPESTNRGPAPESVTPRRVNFGGILQQAGERITVSFTNTPIPNVLFTFAEFSGRSIVPGAQVQGNVTADIRDQPWDVALRTILEAQGLVAQETESGIIRVDNLANLAVQDSVAPVVTQPFRINFATATEVSQAIQPLLSDRGSISVGQGTNTIIVTDLPRIVDDVEALLGQLDIRPPQVQISAEIIFVNRTNLNEFGIIYDLKDSQGNQLNSVNPGAFDQDNDGQITLPDESTEDNVISLGGSSIAALGNANQNVTQPSLLALTSLVVGRHTLISFIQALEELNLSDIQARPSLTVMDNVQARVQVGESTPLRVVEAGGQAGGGVIPQANVQTQETGVILEITPHVTADEHILLELHAERSDAELAASDVGFIFNTQEADSRVLLRDGETHVIAGLMVTEETEVRSGIPGLMSLPLVGRLFRVTRHQQNTQDLMILVTPHIVRDNLN